MTFRKVGYLNVCLFIIVTIFNVHPWYYLMLTIAQLIYVPFILDLIMKNDRSWIPKYFPYLSIPSFLAVSLLHITDQTSWDLFLAIVYFIFTLFIAIYGITRFLKRGFIHFEEFMIDMGCIYLVIGGGWFVAYESGINTGFSPILTWLTGIHFHYAAFLLLVFVGFLGRLTKSISYICVGWIVIIAPMIVAAGITFSVLLELVSVLIYIIGIYGLILLSFKGSFQSSLQKYLIRATYSTLGLTVIFSLLYALGNLLGTYNVTIEFMLRFHGVMNAGLFALMGVIGWAINLPPSKLKPLRFPVSQIRGNGPIGEKVLSGVTDHKLYNGLVDDISSYQPDIDTQTLPPLIIDFYENTNDYRLFSEVNWHTWFKPLAGFYKWISRYVKQINLPLSSKQVEMTGNIYSINDQIDGRSEARAWVRKVKGDVAFVALYSSHQGQGQTYMNISLPMPFSTMVGILELYQLGNDLILTSKKQRENSDSGVYLAIKKHLLKLPIEERFHVKEVKNGILKATHRMWIFHIPFLTIDYIIYKTDKQEFND